MLLGCALLSACAPAPIHAPQRQHIHRTNAAARYRWRGLSLDVARQFFPPSTLRKTIDLAAHYNLNVLHLHLTDNEAWRLPSAAFPLLPSAQHYTAREIRELVAYAGERGVAIVPEIDLPSHSARAIEMYPQLGCGSSDTLCPSPRVRQFAAGVLTEAMALFPAAYVHTGGDEVSGWTAQQRRTFERALDAQIRRAGKRMVVWDDEADAVPADAIVEVWHLGNAAAAASRAGHEIVLAADGPLYFDAVQGAPDQEPQGTRYMSTLEEVYAFAAPRRALGVEAALWSEYLRTDSDLWYALLPRTIALSAVANNRERKQPWRTFRDRTLPAELHWLADNGYTFRVPNTLFTIRESDVRYASVAGNPNAAIAFTAADRVKVVARSLVPGAAIRYRIGAQTKWRTYADPFEAAAGARVDAQTVAPGGRSGAVSSVFIRRSAQPRGSRAFDDVVSP